MIMIYTSLIILVEDGGATRKTGMCLALQAMHHTKELLSFINW